MNEWVLRVTPTNDNKCFDTFHTKQKYIHAWPVNLNNTVYTVNGRINMKNQFFTIKTSIPLELNKTQLK